MPPSGPRSWPKHDLLCALAWYEDVWGLGHVVLRLGQIAMRVMPLARGLHAQFYLRGRNSWYWTPQLPTLCVLYFSSMENPTAANSNDMDQCCSSFIEINVSIKQLATPNKFRETQGNLSIKQLATTNKFG